MGRAGRVKKADAYDKGFNREVVVLRSDCIRHQVMRSKVMRQVVRQVMRQVMRQVVDSQTKRNAKGGAKGNAKGNAPVNCFGSWNTGPSFCSY